MTMIPPSQMESFLTVKESNPSKTKEDSVDDDLFWKVLIKMWEDEDEEDGDGDGNGEWNLAQWMIHVQCDLWMTYFQTRQHHWHTEGMTFRDVHLMFDEATAILLEHLDKISERIVAMGNVAPTDPQTILKISDTPTIDQTSRDTKEMINQAIMAIKDLLEDIGELNEKAAEEKQVGIQNLIGDMAQDLEVLLYKYQQFLSTFGG